MIFKRPAATQGLLLQLAATAEQCTTGVPEAHAQVLDIPTDGLELWLSADGPREVVDDRITECTGRSGRGNNATHDSFGADVPTLATANGKPTFAFSGGYAGFHFRRLSTIRSVGLRCSVRRRPRHPAGGRRAPRTARSRKRLGAIL